MPPGAIGAELFPVGPGPGDVEGVEVGEAGEAGALDHSVQLSVDDAAGSTVTVTYVVVSTVVVVAESGAPVYHVRNPKSIVSDDSRVDAYRLDLHRVSQQWWRIRKNRTRTQPWRIAYMTASRRCRSTNRRVGHRSMPGALLELMKVGESGMLEQSDRPSMVDMNWSGRRWPPRWPPRCLSW